MQVTNDMEPNEELAAAAIRLLSRQYVELLRNADRKAAIDLVLRASDEYPVEQIYTSLLQEAQYEIGRLWETNEISVAQEHYSTAVTQLVMSLLYPRICETPKTRGTFIGVCAEGELHEVGIRMVCDLFELRGWQSYYLGSSIPLDDLLRFIVEKEPDVIGVSAITIEHVESIRQLIPQFRAAAPRKVKILAGGRPFLLQPSLWREIGADGSAASAVEAVTLAETLLAPSGSST
ncbi:MAG TPA: cobalamin-dependent protein [Thermoanaerobaculia bacterium]|jgi:methanogenic corrinoid protein MtbC1|nr:cobalamin-dependent protein [Thermoanaerobaculia bacterium]